MEERLTADRVNRLTLERFSLQTLDQTLANLPVASVFPSVASLRGKFSGLAVVVGAGPSLEKNGKALSKYSGKILVIAASHALQRLSNMGVKADIAVALDPQKAADHFQDAAPPTAAVLAISTHPENFSVCENIYIYAGNKGVDDWPFRAFGEDAWLHAGGSVTHAAYSLAGLLGASLTALVGCDFAFAGDRYYGGDSPVRVTVSPDGREFVAAAPGEPPIEHGPATLVTGWNHSPLIHTSIVMSHWISWLAEQRTGRCVNATEGGAHIPGWAHAPLEDVLENGAGLPPPSLKAAPNPSRRQEMKRFLKKLREQSIKAGGRAALCRRLLEAKDLAGLGREEQVCERLCDGVLPLLMALDCKRYYRISDMLASPNDYSVGEFYRYIEDLVPVLDRKLHGVIRRLNDGPSE